MDWNPCQGFLPEGKGAKRLVLVRGNPALLTGTGHPRDWDPRLASNRAGRAHSAVALRATEQRVSNIATQD